MRTFASTMTQKATARWVEEAGRRAIIVGGNVKDSVHCRKLVDRALRDFGKLDVLVNNAPTR